jgi:signal peptidase I
VVVFRAPTSQSIYYIKRVIGLPGEKIEITSDKVIITNKEHPNGAELQEPYLESALSPNPFGTIVMTLKDSEYFVMGDNRSNSLDSRRWGPLVRSDIVGAVRLRLWPVSQLSFFSKQVYAQ